MSDFLDAFNHSKFKFHSNTLINADIIIFLELYTKHKYPEMSVFMEILNKKTVLISGGIASFGNIFIKTSLKTYGK